AHEYSFSPLSTEEWHWDHASASRLRARESTEWAPGEALAGFAEGVFSDVGFLQPAPVFVPMPMTFETLDRTVTPPQMDRRVVRTDAELAAPDLFALVGRAAIHVKDFALASGFWRVNAGRVEASLESVICFPADPADR